MGDSQNEACSSPQMANYFRVSIELIPEIPGRATCFGKQTKNIYFGSKAGLSRSNPIEIQSKIPRQTLLSECQTKWVP
jgi:hypothetical protein